MSDDDLLALLNDDAQFWDLRDAWVVTHAGRRLGAWVSTELGWMLEGTALLEQDGAVLAIALDAIKKHGTEIRFQSLRFRGPPPRQTLKCDSDFSDFPFFDDVREEFVATREQIAWPKQKMFEVRVLARDLLATRQRAAHYSARTAELTDVVVEQEKKLIAALRNALEVAARVCDARGELDGSAQTRVEAQACAAAIRELVE